MQQLLLTESYVVGPQQTLTEASSLQNAKTESQMKFGGNLFEATNADFACAALFILTIDLSLLLEWLDQRKSKSINFL
jgi:hypothetical protein